MPRNRYPFLPEFTSDRLALIHRQVSFELAAFDLLKNWQRHLEATLGRQVTNSETLSRLILSNPQP